MHGLFESERKWFTWAFYKQQRKGKEESVDINYKRDFHGVCPSMTWVFFWERRAKVSIAAAILRASDWKERFLNGR